MGVYSGSRPYGEIFTINTGGIDAIAKQVYREQQIREQQKMQQDKALDDEFAKNVAGVKSVDIPDITKAYSDFKQAHINLQKKGQKATPQDQMDVMIKKANAFSEIAASKEDKEYWGMRAKDGRNNKRYNPNYQTIISEGLNTRTKERNRDADDDKLLYKYAMPNIDKEIANAVGKGDNFDLLIGVDEKDPLTDKYETVKKINPPNTFYNNLFSGLGARSDNQNFTRSVMDKYTDEEKDKLRTDFELKIQDPRFKAIYGEVQPFPASAANTELGQAVALKTMEAYSQLPLVGEEKRVLNKDRNKKANQDFSSKQQEDRQRHAEAMQLQGFKNALARQANAARLGLYKDKEGTPAPPNILDEFTVEFGEKYKEPLSGADMMVVDVKNIPVKYRPLLSTSPMKVGDKEFYVVDETGSYIGRDKQVITPVSVADNYIKTYGNTKFKLEGRKKFLQAEQNQAPTQKQPPVPKKETPKSNKKQVPGWNN